MRAPGEGEVMNAQFDKKNAGWGEQDSMTAGLERMKKEQAGARADVKEQRAEGQNIDDGQAIRAQNEGLDSV